MWRWGHAWHNLSKRLNHDPAGHCTKPQLSQWGGKEYMTNLTRTRYLMGNLYAAAIKHGGLWCSADRAGVLWPPAHEKPGLLQLLVLIRPGPLPPKQKLSTQPLPFHSNLRIPWEIIFRRRCCFPLGYCAFCFILRRCRLLCLSLCSCLDCPGKWNEKKNSLVCVQMFMLPASKFDGFFKIELMCCRYLW
ncbi:hypothetical protein GQ55_1G023700 [Panicum hallii var. hallii]|uniref:Uncharacterized protein n=1 Tax=Panicum hallii var. hallii TaxID=1504633 RepID=A0A2T7F1E3_9POAL|nr:hypothetical protein GQ55_1G023700 [Panicum hallii var. hallii]